MNLSISTINIGDKNSGLRGEVLERDRGGIYCKAIL